MGTKRRIKRVKAPVTQAKAKKIKRDKTIRGKPLTPAQEGLFGVIAGGAKTVRVKSKAKKKKNK